LLPGRDEDWHSYDQAICTLGLIIGSEASGASPEAENLPVYVCISLCQLAVNPEQRAAEAIILFEIVRQRRQQLENEIDHLFLESGLATQVERIQMAGQFMVERAWFLRKRVRSADN
jgi:hypothetical protein